jgi:hypothetical protein
VFDLCSGELDDILLDDADDSLYIAEVFERELLIELLTEGDETL